MPVVRVEARCILVFTGFLPRALVAQRIEQKTSNLLAAGSTPAEGALGTTSFGLNGYVRGRSSLSGEAIIDCRTR